MRYLIFLCCLTALLACDTPGPKYAGLNSERLRVGKSVFDVRIKGDKAQAIRLNSEWAPRPEFVRPRALIAIEQASGCEVKRMDGDQVIIEARLKCDGLSAEQMQPKDYNCDVSVVNEYSADVVCTPGI